ncbi:MAG: NAD(P)H-hydrate dehydratase [Phycisphaeraceae bacterium]
MPTPPTLPPTLPALPQRPADGHKGTFGTVIVVGGSPTMLGAPALAAGSALRSGAGLCKIATHAAILPFCLTIEPSATGMILPDDPADFEAFAAQFDARTVLAVGPGLGTGDHQTQLLARLLQTDRPAVLDADALNTLAAQTQPIRRDAPTVLTPHPGEYQRLADAAGITLSGTDPAQRPQAAQALAAHHYAVVVLKGSRTIVADADRTHHNTTGNVALATAGSGDVLTGLIASLIAQKMPAYEAAALAVHLHGLAADLWAAAHGNAGLTAKALMQQLPDTLHRMR